jgi:hypothetical protein
MEQFRQASIANGVDEVFLNFANYDEPKAAKLIERINADETLPKITMVGVGPKNNDILSVSDFYETSNIV